jgi:hypothetical protein
MNYSGGFGQQFCPVCTPVGMTGQYGFNPYTQPGQFGFNPYMQTGQFGFNPYVQTGQFGFNPYFQTGQFGFNPYWQTGQFGYGSSCAPVGFEGMTGQYGGAFGGYGPGYMGTYPMQQGFYGGGSPYQSFAGMPDDEDIEEMIFDSLDADPMVPYDGDIDVEVQAGVVTLTGTVPNKRIKHAVGDDAWWVPGVLDVNNNLQVVGRRTRGEHREGSTTGRVGEGSNTQAKRGK